MAGELSPEAVADINIRRRQIRERADLGVRQQDYLQQSSGREHGRQLGDLTRQWDQMRDKMPWGYGARGLMNSGIWQRALQNYGIDRNRQVANLKGRFADQTEGFNLARDQLGQLREGGLRDVDELETARIAQVAATLRGAGF